jgi:CubicO group peptidase (beta-lactamase class C family)
MQPHRLPSNSRRWALVAVLASAAVLAGCASGPRQITSSVQTYASMGGVGSARALAKFYSVFANGGKFNGVQVIPTWIQRALGEPLSQAEDGVLCVPAAFSAGMMMDPIDPETNAKVRQLFGPSEGAFGHPGAGGSLAFADPETGISFAYVMNQMEVGVLPSDKALGLVRALYRRD